MLLYQNQGASCITCVWQEGALAPNKSSDISMTNYTDPIPYPEWAVKQENEYASKAGPVTTRIDKAECERLITQMEAQKWDGYVLRQDVG